MVCVYSSMRGPILVPHFAVRLSRHVCSRQRVGLSDLAVIAGNKTVLELVLELKHMESLHTLINAKVDLDCPFSGRS